MLTILLTVGYNIYLLYNNNVNTYLLLLLLSYIIILYYIILYYIILAYEMELK